jgi:phage host-nuclease inhibitor protein Gam
VPSSNSERIGDLREELARFKTIAEQSESTKAAAERHYQAMLAEIAQERDTAAQEAAEAAAEVARLRGRGLWARLFSAG